MKFWLVISLFLLGLPAQAAPNCGPPERSVWLKIGKAADYFHYEATMAEALKTSDSYVRLDPVHPEKYKVDAYLGRRGELSFEMYTKIGGRYSKLRADYEMQNIMKHFGDKVKAIEAEWTTAFGSDHSNLDLFNDAVEAAMNKADIAGLDEISPELLETAAWNTWTGKQAKKYGFTVIESIGTIASDDPNLLYREVNVRFRRP